MTETKQEEKLLLLINGHRRDMPVSYSDWIDWKKALPEGIAFFPRKTSWFSLIVSSFFSAVILWFVAFTNYYTTSAILRGESMSFLSLATWIGFTLLALFYGTASLLRLRSEIGVLYSQSKGQLRHGLYLGPDSLLIWLPTDRCHLVPRKLLKSVKRESSRLNYNGSLSIIKLIFDDDLAEGIEKHFGLVAFPDHYLEEPADEVIHCIHNWIDSYDGSKYV